MGVLMRGVDLPKNCEECNFKGECRDYWEKIREAYTRPSWCPLVEVVDPKIVGKHAGVTIIDELFDKDINVHSKDETLTCRNKDHYADCEYKDNCNPVVCFKALDEFREMVTEPQERSE